MRSGEVADRDANLIACLVGVGIGTVLGLSMIGRVLAGIGIIVVGLGTAGYMGKAGLYIMELLVGIAWATVALGCWSEPREPTPYPTLHRVVGPAISMAVVTMLLVGVVRTLHFPNSDDSWPPQGTAAQSSTEAPAQSSVVSEHRVSRSEPVDTAESRADRVRRDALNNEKEPHPLSKYGRFHSGEVGLIEASPVYARPDLKSPVLVYAAHGTVVTIAQVIDQDWYAVTIKTDDGHTAAGNIRRDHVMDHVDVIQESVLVNRAERLVSAR